ncbi:MAG TPA: DUF5666 domain-containing protein [Candidatus Acidoferrum sp.]|nr:DUF5666 domain-containing protein [Candidatus Acidoferrum sp.]
MKGKCLMLVLALAFAGGAAFAHGNKVHVKGTVEKIGGDSLQVRTPEGKTVEVKLVASTVYILHTRTKPGDAPDAKENKPAKLADLAVGDAVVIHATPKDGNLEADEIRFSAPSTNKMASAASRPKV